MSNMNGRPVVSGNALVWAIAAMFIAVVAGVVALSIGLPESQNPAGLAAQLLGSFAALVAVLGTLFTVRQVKASVEQIGTDVDAMRNGEMEGKLHDVLEEHERRSRG